MKKIVLAAALALSGAVFASPVVAMPASPLTAPSVLGDLQQVQYIYGGRNYCWYDNGWRGPGYYWCGYAFRRGYGWGGGDGWRGWRGGGRGPGFGPGRGPRGGYGGGRGGGGYGGHGGHGGPR